MLYDTISRTLPLVSAALLLTACDGPTTAPAELEDRSALEAEQPNHALAVSPLPEPFTARAPLDPYFFNQAPDLMFRSRVRADLAIQRLVTSPGEGAWHTHDGPSFAIVEQGRVRIVRFTRKDGCRATVYGPGEAAGNTYYEEAGEVHRADVIGSAIAVEYKVRFNTPIGAPFANPAEAPC